MSAAIRFLTKFCSLATHMGLDVETLPPLPPFPTDTAMQSTEGSGVDPEEDE